MRGRPLAIVCCCGRVRGGARRCQCWSCLFLRWSFRNRFGVVSEWSSGRLPVVAPVLEKIWGPEKSAVLVVKIWCSPEVVVKIQGGQEGGPEVVAEGVGRKGTRCRSQCRRERLHGRHPEACATNSS